MKKLTWFVIVIVLVVVGFCAYYFSQSSGAKSSTSESAALSVAESVSADPIVNLTNRRLPIGVRNEVLGKLVTSAGQKQLDASFLEKNQAALLSLLDMGEDSSMRKSAVSNVPKIYNYAGYTAKPAFDYGPLFDKISVVLSKDTDEIAFSALGALFGTMADMNLERAKLEIINFSSSYKDHWKSRPITLLNAVYILKRNGEITKNQKLVEATSFVCSNKELAEVKDEVNNTDIKSLLSKICN